jgi:hypothetical protein
MARVTDAMENCEVIYKELENSGIIDVLEEHRREISQLPERHILPAFDLPLHFMPFEHLMDETDKESTPWSKVETKRRMEIVKEQTIVFIVRNNQPPSEPKPEPAERGRLLRWVAASGRILSGVVVTGGNLLLGAAGLGIVGSIPAAAPTMVPVAIASTGSMLAGVTQINDGLEKVGGLLK